jgi:putative transposase
MVYLTLLREYAADVACRVHGYVLMTNHVHLLLSAVDNEGPSVLMRRLGQRYVQYFNRRYERSGTLWEGRFRSSLVDNEQYLLICQRYIELNPVRAGMVEAPEDYPWSSYRANALGADDPLLTPHPVYTNLGRNDEDRRTAYRYLFEEKLSDQLLTQIRHAGNGNRPLGPAAFVEEIAKIAGRKPPRQRSGRPRSNEKQLPKNVF